MVGRIFLNESVVSKRTVAVGFEAVVAWIVRRFGKIEWEEGLGGLYWIWLGERGSAPQHSRHRTD